MKKLTYEEFNDRVQAVDRARKIFIESGITKNITHAFKLYQEILAEQEREIFITSTNGGKLPSVLDKYARPKCSQCDSDMGLRIIDEPKGYKNVNGYKTCWECYNCAHEEYSYKTIEEWMKELNIKPSCKEVKKDAV